MFPIAYTVATYLWALLAAVEVIATVALAALLIMSLVTLIATFLGSSGRRRLLRNLAAVAVLLLPFGFALGSLVWMEEEARQAVTWVALKADFFISHRCGTEGWPKSVSRVASVGDEQVLAYRDAGNPLVVLPCRRQFAPAPKAAL